MNGTAIWAAGHCRPSESARELQRTNAPRPIMANSPVTSLEEKERTATYHRMPGTILEHDDDFQ